MAEEEIKE